MRTLKYVNNKGKSITITYKGSFLLSLCDGFHEKIGKVNTAGAAYGIGTTWNGTSLGERNLNIKGVITNNIDENRELLYEVFSLDSEGILYYYENGKSRKIKCVVESVKVLEKVGYTKDFLISLICPNPRFSDIEPTKISMASWSPNFEFPLIIPKNEGIDMGIKNNTTMGTVENNTDLNYGMTIVFKANGPVNYPYLMNVDTREYIQIDKIMEAGEKFIITTHNDNKNIIYENEMTGEKKNVNYLMIYGSKYLQVLPGTNTFRAGAGGEETEDNLETTIEYLREYEAV